jgi:cellobionic acid phosphorylase
VIREFRGATFHVVMRREPGLSRIRVVVDSQPLPANILAPVQAGKTYHVEVAIPASPE